MEDINSIVFLNSQYNKYGKINDFSQNPGYLDKNEQLEDALDDIEDLTEQEASDPNNGRYINLQEIDAIDKLTANVFPLDITLNGGGVFEVGTVNSFDITWEISRNKKLITPDKVLLNGEDVEGKIYSVSDLTSSEAAKIDYTLSVDFEEIEESTKTVSAIFTYPIFFGAVVEGFTINESNVSALSKMIRDGKEGITFSFNLEDKKSLIAIPSIFEELSSIKDVNGFEYLSSYEKTNLTIGGVDYIVYLLNTPATISDLKQTIN